MFLRRAKTEGLLVVVVEGVLTMLPAASREASGSMQVSGKR